MISVYAATTPLTNCSLAAVGRRMWSIFIAWVIYADFFSPQEYSWWERAKYRLESYGQHCLWLRHVRFYFQLLLKIIFPTFFFFFNSTFLCSFHCSGARTPRPLSWTPAASATAFSSSFWRSGCSTTRRSLWCWTELQRVQNNDDDEWQCARIYSITSHKTACIIKS